MRKELHYRYLSEVSIVYVAEKEIEALETRTTSFPYGSVWVLLQSWKDYVVTLTYPPAWTKDLRCAWLCLKRVCTHWVADHSTSV